MQLTAYIVAAKSKLKINGINQSKWSVTVNNLILYRKEVYIMNFFKNRYKDLHKKSLGNILYTELKLGLFIYTGCLTGSIGIPYLLGDTAVLNQLGPLSVNYMLATLLLVSISSGITLYKRSQSHESV